MGAFMSGLVRVRTPATSANLGPGFDALGLALCLYDEVTARVTDSGYSVRVLGEGAGVLPCDENHLVFRSMMAAFTQMGVYPPGVELMCDNGIPQERGLGSSAAAIVAGVVAARALVADQSRHLSDTAVLRLAAQLEGHPDNVAPCLLGGLTIAWAEPAGPRAVRLSVASDIRPTLFIPSLRALTAEARASLPPLVSHHDAAFAAGRASLLIHALTQDPSLLLPATEDRLHQQYRAAKMPQSANLMIQLRQQGIPAVLSGAGPTVLVFTTKEEPLPHDAGWSRQVVEVDPHGTVVEVD